MSDDLYSMTGPTRWAGPPERFSYCSLSSIKTCPLRWQLERSSFGGFERLPLRPSEARLLGQLIHEVLDALLRALARAGRPARGTAAFREAIKAVNPLALIEEKLEATRAAVASQPRARGFQVRRTPIEVYRQTASLFQRQYRGEGEGRAPEPVEALEPQAEAADGARADVAPPDGPELRSKLRRLQPLSEQYIEHPSLPVRGIIDLVSLDEDRIIIGDFKTGKRHESHRDQLTLYALMWWRVTGDLPHAVEVLYSDGVERYEVTSADLEAAEQRIAQAIEEARGLLSQQPAPARPNAFCGACDGRPFCSTYWKDTAARHARGEAVRDLEVTIVGQPVGEGVSAETTLGEDVSLVWSPHQHTELEQLRSGQRLRVLSATPEGDVLVLQPWTEVFCGGCS